MFVCKATQSCFVAWTAPFCLSYCGTHLACRDLVVIELGVYIGCLTSMGLHDGNKDNAVPA